MSAAFTGEVHPLAARWPLLPADELQELAESIARKGLRHPIVLDMQGRLVDGRNRLAACDLVNVVPDFVTDATLTTDDDVRSFIATENADRRNVSTGQKAMALADDLAAQGRRRNGRWARGSLANDRESDRSGWRDLMHQAGLVIDWRPDLVDDVIRGHLADDPETKVTLNAAAELAMQVRDAEARAEAEAKRQAEMLADLKDNRPDLATLVDRGDLSLEDALTVRDKELAATEKAQEEERLRIAKFSATVCRSIWALEPLHQHDDRREQVRYELRFDAAGGQITAQSIRDAIESLEFILITHKESLI